MPAHYTAFAGARCIARGPLVEVLPILKERFDRDRSDTVLVFETESGQAVDFDLRGSLEDAMERVAPSAAKGPGRPRLGVKSREVSLLPRHWRWLEQQPKGISSSLRTLIDQAIKHEPGPARARRVRASLQPFLTALAGDRPNFEEACRALFAGDTARFESLIARWPKDIREHASEKAREADRLEKKASA